MKSPGWFEERRQEILQLRSAAASPIRADCVFENESSERIAEVHVSGAGRERLNNLMLEVLRGTDLELGGTDYRWWLPLVIAHGKAHGSTQLVTDDPAKKASGDWRLDSSSSPNPARTQRGRNRHFDDVRLRHKDPIRQSFSASVNDLAALAAEYVEHLITASFEASRTQKVEQAGRKGPLKERPRWLEELFEKLGTTANELQVKHGGPDRKTTVRILDGHECHDKTLEQLAAALTDAIKTAQKRGVTSLPQSIEVTDIPRS